MPAKLTIDQVSKIIEKHNGILVSIKYKNVKSRLRILCKKCNEVFVLSLSKVKKGTWCPYCNLSKAQKKLYDIFKQIYPKHTIKNNYKRFNWLRTSAGGKQEIDIFIYNKNKSFTLAIEYDGEQHFMPVKFGAKSDAQAEKDLKKTQKMDIMKNNKIARNKDDIKYFIRFNYKDELTMGNVLSRLDEEGIPYEL